MSDDAYRIALRPDDAGELDDVVILDVATFRAEMMSKSTMWMACYFPDSDERVSFWVRARGGRIELTVTEQPDESDTFVYEEQKQRCGICGGTRGFHDHLNATHGPVHEWETR